MASIDRYRPPREGYQPPTIPGASRPDGPSRSPVPRREVPPAAPTPPQHSARTSPPRPQGQSQSGEQSPAQSGHNGLSAVANQWSFTSEEVQSTPSIIDGIPPSEERLRRAKGVNFIYQAGVMLDLPQITLWVAGVFFHRFFMRFSMVQEKGGIHHYVSKFYLPLANLCLRDKQPVKMKIKGLTEPCAEYCGHGAFPCKQSRRKLPKNEGHYHRRCQGGSKECKAYHR